MKQLNIDDDLQPVLELVDSTAAKDNILVQITSLDQSEIQKFFRDRAKLALSYGVSFGYYQKNSKRLVGMMLNSIYQKDSERRIIQHNYGALQRSYSHELQAVIRFLQYFTGGLHQELETDCYMDLGMSVIIHKLRGCHLAVPALERCEQVARCMDIPYLTSFASVKITQSLLLAQGYRVLRKTSYEDYVDPETGRKLFTSTPKERDAILLYKALKP